MKYKILIDYGSEGFKFDDGEYQTVDEAVKKAITLIYSNPFYIVEIIDWEANKQGVVEKIEAAFGSSEELLYGDWLNVKKEL